MKRKSRFLVISIFIICLVIGWMIYQTSERAILVSTYSQLEDYAKKQIIDYKAGTVSTAKIPNSSINIRTFSFDETYQNNTVYVVTFQSRSRSIDGDIIRLVDRETKKVIGYNYRD